VAESGDHHEIVVSVGQALAQTAVQVGGEVAALRVVDDVAQLIGVGVDSLSLNV
jgi:hypothetical protein